MIRVIIPKKQNQHTNLFLWMVMVCVMVMHISSAHAVCTDPDGEAGDQVYNMTYNVMQYCDGTGWISAGGTAVTQWEDGDDDDIYYQSGRVGIGINSPLTALHVFGDIRVDGAMRLSNQGIAVDCVGQNTGDVRYNTGTGKIEVCNGADWNATVGGFTLGAIPFANNDGDLVEDPSNLFWDEATDSLKVGERVQFVGQAGAIPVSANVVAKTPKPDPFSFTNLTDVTPNTVQTSDTVALAGFTGYAVAYCSGNCSAIARNGVWGSNTGIFLPGDTIAIRQTSSASYGVTMTAAVTVGATASADWDVSTPGTLMGLTQCPAGDLGVPDIGCARLFGADPNDLNDVGVFAGDLPDTVELFVQRCDLGMTWDGADCIGTRSALAWKDVSTNSATTDVAVGASISAAGAINGSANTSTLVGDGSGVHAAAETCAALAGGTWYLPAITELDTIYSNLISSGDTNNPRPTVGSGSGGSAAKDGVLASSFDTTGSVPAGFYWSSSETDVVDAAWSQRFNDGHESNGITKDYTLSIRCARRG